MEEDRALNIEELRAIKAQCELQIELAEVLLKLKHNATLTGTAVNHFTVNLWKVALGDALRLINKKEVSGGNTQWERK